VYVHFYFHRYVSAFKINTKNIKIIEPNFDVQNLLLRSRILITDYSSVCWDFYYLDKPVLFYQFDQEEYNKKRGAYIDLDKDLFGMKSTKLIELLQHLEITVEKPNRHIDDYKHLKSKYFNYMDNQNCKRIVNEFKKSIS
ncbi:CDP-glycerol glycerophosphotransferase family protein, partial [Priestia megaterium]